VEEREQGHSAEEVSELGTGIADEDDGSEPFSTPEAGIVGGGDQGAHFGSLGGEPAPDATAAFRGAARMSEGPEVQTGEDDEERERFHSELDWDDIAEAFIGSLIAGVVILLILRVLPTRRRSR